MKNDSLANTVKQMFLEANHAIHTRLAYPDIKQAVVGSNWTGGNVRLVDAGSAGGHFVVFESDEDRLQFVMRFSNIL